MDEEDMNPSPHTRLMNYFIGMCKNQKEWVSVLADLGYELQLIEQRIRTSTDQISHPDIVASSNKLVNFLVCDCKGGITVDEEQLDRYSTITRDSFANYIRPFALQEFTVDVCLCDLEKNHPFISAQSKGFPIITFGQKAITKSGQFKKQELNVAFKDPISLEGLSPTLSYYPFSTEDSYAYIAPYVIRGLLSIARKNSKGGASVTDENVITQDEMVTTVFNQIFDVLSDRNKKQLRDKIRMVIQWTLQNEKMRESLEFIERQGSVRIIRHLDKLRKNAEEFIADLESKKILDDFLNL